MTNVKNHEPFRGPKGTDGAGPLRIIEPSRSASDPTRPFGGRLVAASDREGFGGRRFPCVCAVRL